MKKILLCIALVSSLLYAEERECYQQNGFEIGADWIYWKIYQDNMDLGAEVSSFRVNGTQQIQSEVICPHFSTSNGFKVFANYLFCGLNWQLGAFYTRLNSRCSGNDVITNYDPQSNFIVLDSLNFPIFTVLTSNNQNFSELNSIWCSNFNYFDLDFSRVLGQCQGFAILPHLGFRVMWFKEQLFVNGASPVVTFHSRLQEKYVGFGVEGGLTANFPLICGFSFKGQIGGSLLYAKFDNHEAIQVFPPDAPVTISVGRNIYHLSPTIDGFIGLQYQNCWSCGLLTLHAGWEEHIIIDANHFSLRSSDFTLEGLTLGGSFTF